MYYVGRAVGRNYGTCQWNGRWVFRFHLRFRVLSNSNRQPSIAFRIWIVSSCRRTAPIQREEHQNRPYEAHIDAQKNFILVLRRSLVRVPHGERVPFVSFNGIAILEADISKSIGWVDWYKSKRAKYETHIHRIEKDIPVYPEFEILKIGGKYTQLKVKANIPVFELKYRVRQAFAFF